MIFKYVWKNKEANFGKPLKHQVKGGAHITFEIILKWNGKYIALRRPSIPGHEAPQRSKKYPNGLLYFCHNLIRYGESVDQCIKRIVKAQTSVHIRSYRIVDIDSFVQSKDQQWAIVLYIIAELAKKPRVGIFGNRINEVVAFTKNTIPGDFAWWTQGEVKQFLKRFGQKI